MSDSLRKIVRLLVVAVLVAGGARAVYHRAYPEPAAATRRDTRHPDNAPVAVVHDTASAVASSSSANANGFADEEAGRQRAREDSIFRAANGEGLTTKQTYVAPLYPETAH